VTRDVQLILAAQAARAVAYGFASVLLGVSLAENGWSPGRVSLLLTAVIVGTAIMTVFVGSYGDRIGRRRTYTLLFLALSVTGIVFAFSDEFFVLAPVALAGALSTDVVESGPFTSLEQAMLPQATSAEQRTHVFGVYNAIATVAGAIGALAAGGPTLLRDQFSAAPADERFFLILVPAGLCGVLAAGKLSGAIEGKPRTGYFLPLYKSRKNTVRLSGLFAFDAFAGGFVVQSFIAYWFSVKFDVSAEVLGAVFFAVGMLQSISFLVATRIAVRIGLLNTMVFTHLPSNLLLAAIPLAPTPGTAIALLLGRFAISQMDVPTRQAYIAALIPPDERTAAVAYTNSARYATRPVGAALAGATQEAALGLPFFIGGGLKIVYDVAIWLWFRRVPLPDETKEQSS